MYWSHILPSSNTLEKWDSIVVVLKKFIDFKTACDFLREEVLYNILKEIWVLMKVMLLSNTYSHVRTRIYLLVYSYPNDLQQNAV
jgi:hypothetical protein